MHPQPSQAPHLAIRRQKQAMLTVILILAGLICFALFFKAIDFFDKI
jgi:hypothetical protein